MAEKTIIDALKKLESKGYGMADAIACFESGKSVDEYLKDKELSEEEYKKLMSDDAFSKPGRFSGDVVKITNDE
ncbi:hypothetical protein GM418_10900 [Maribellus comscasis]|uniref:Uncharacterized protein n=1 Tax=Maribellus comscasis TaxID=2681766 RepID=A0A6I6JSU0_9BACT|nr:hypothetical protein [Maribellus comscasis]QGY44148.1 hypothetical protein GM418_10900 [Maribellus comscasis]